MKGIRLEDDPILKAEFERGLRNSDPSEVYKHCEFVVVGCENASPLAEEIGIIGMGEVLITCRKLGAQARDKDINTGFLRLRSQLCLGCRFHKPRPSNWKFSPQDEPNIHGDLL